MKRVGVMIAAMVWGLAAQSAQAETYQFDLSPLPLANAIEVPEISNPLDTMGDLTALTSVGAENEPLMLASSAFEDPRTASTTLAGWQNQFSLRQAGRNGLEAPLDRFEFSAGSNWGFTLGFANDRESLFDPEAVSAGAFYRVSPRLRIGGEFNFIDSDESLVLDTTPVDNQAAELKLESAFRF